MSSLPVSVASDLVSRTRLLPEPVDPLTTLGPGGFAWFASGFGLATAGVAARVPARAVADVLASVDADDPLGQPGTGPLAVGALGFSGTGDLVVPARVVGRTPDGRSWLTEIGPADDTAEGWGSSPQLVAGLGSADDRPAWCARVEEALARISAGALQKVVLARQVDVELPGPVDLAHVVDRLRSGNPSCFTYAAGGFVGASPELLVRRRGRLVTSRPMAGTVAQGGRGADDELLVAGMTSSAKEQVEHRLVVGAVRAALGSVCDDVVAGRRPEVVRLPTVAHLATTVTGVLRRPGLSALALARLLHPTPAVAGVPRAAALETIAELEGFDRGLYAGPVGWVDARGDGDWALALRGATIDGTRAHLTAGAGIVAGSEPLAEWSETEAKLEAVRSALLG